MLVENIMMYSVSVCVCIYVGIVVCVVICSDDSMVIYVNLLISIIVGSMY